MKPRDTYRNNPPAAISKEKERGQGCHPNFLAEEALHPWLLFIDSNMQVIHPHYLTTYLQSVKKKATLSMVDIRLKGAKR